MLHRLRMLKNRALKRIFEPTSGRSGRRLEKIAY
jgi:hypothetical protein